MQNKIKPAREATICRRRGRKEQGFQYLGMLARIGTMAGLWSRGAHTISDLLSKAKSQCAQGCSCETPKRVGGVVEIERTDGRVQGRCSWETRVKDNGANIGCMRVVSMDRSSGILKDALLDLGVSQRQ